MTETIFLLNHADLSYLVFLLSVEIYFVKIQNSMFNRVGTFNCARPQIRDHTVSLIEIFLEKFKPIRLIEQLRIIES